MNKEAKPRKRRRRGTKDTLRFKRITLRLERTTASRLTELADALDTTVGELADIAFERLLENAPVVPDELTSARDQARDAREQLDQAKNRFAQDFLASVRPETASMDAAQPQASTGRTRANARPSGPSPARRVPKAPEPEPEPSVASGGQETQSSMKQAEKIEREGLLAACEDALAFSQEHGRPTELDHGSWHIKVSHHAVDPASTMRAPLRLEKPETPDDRVQRLNGFGALAMKRATERYPAWPMLFHTNADGSVYELSLAPTASSGPRSPLPPPGPASGGPEDSAARSDHDRADDEPPAL